MNLTKLPNDVTNVSPLYSRTFYLMGELLYRYLKGHDVLTISSGDNKVKFMSRFSLPPISVPPTSSLITTYASLSPLIPPTLLDRLISGRV